MSRNTYVVQFVHVIFKAYVITISSDADLHHNCQIRKLILGLHDVGDFKYVYPYIH